MKQPKFLSQSITALVVSGFILATAPAVLSQFDIASENGYGYGVCGEALTGVTSRYLHGDNAGKVALRWDAVSEDCTDGLEYYQLQLRKSNNQLVEWWNTTNTRKRITMEHLTSNQTYKWRVRAVYSDGTATDWSLYDQFRTKPNAPSELRISNINTTSARVSGKNVARSQVLQKYQLLLKQGSEVVQSRSIQHGLKRPRFAVTLNNLDPSTTYTVQVRAVYSSMLRSGWTSAEFTTAAE